MCEPQFQQVQESIAAVTLNTQIEFVRGMQDEFGGARCLALDYSGYEIDAQILPHG
jgi:hypothetical protein